MLRGPRCMIQAFQTQIFQLRLFLYRSTRFVTDIAEKCGIDLQKNVANIEKKGGNITAMVNMANTNLFLRPAGHIQ